MFCCLIATPIILTTNDLLVLSRHLHNVSPKWYMLGLQLGLSKEMLAKLIPLNCDPAVLLNQMLSTWLQRANPPTLDALCRALSHTTVGAEGLAQWLLHRKYLWIFNSYTPGRSTRLIMLSSAIIVSTELSSLQSLRVFNQLRKKRVQIQLEILSPILHSLRINLGREVTVLPFLIPVSSLLCPLILLVMANH